VDENEKHASEIGSIIEARSTTIGLFERRRSLSLSLSLPPSLSVLTNRLVRPTNERRSTDREPTEKKRQVVGRGGASSYRAERRRKSHRYANKIITRTWTFQLQLGTFESLPRLKLPRRILLESRAKSVLLGCDLLFEPCCPMVNTSVRLPSVSPSLRAPQIVRDSRQRESDWLPASSDSSRSVVFRVRMRIGRSSSWRRSSARRSSALIR